MTPTELFPFRQCADVHGTENSFPSNRCLDIA